MQLPVTAHLTGNTFLVEYIYSFAVDYFMATMGRKTKITSYIL
jgi:hypothetical protein